MLPTSPNRTSGPEKPSETGNGRLNGGHTIAAGRSADPKTAKPVVASEASAELRDRLLAGLNEITCGEDAAIWAHCSLGEKNRLTAPDSKRVEEAFQVKLAALAAFPADRPETQRERPAAARCSPIAPEDAQPKTRPGTTLSDKSVLTLPEPRRIRDASTSGL